VCYKAYVPYRSFLLQDIDRNGNQGIGKPESLSGNLAGYWGRRIDDVNRFIYRLKKGMLEIAQCRSHYGDKQPAFGLVFEHKA